MFKISYVFISFLFLAFAVFIRLKIEKRKESFTKKIFWKNINDLISTIPYVLLFLSITVILYLIEVYFRSQKNNLLSDTIIFFYIYFISFFPILQQSEDQYNSIIGIITPSAVTSSNLFVDLMEVFRSGVLLLIGHDIDHYQFTKWSKLNFSFKEKFILFMRALLATFILGFLTSYIKLFFNLNSYLLLYFIFLLFLFFLSLIILIIKRK